MFALKTFQEKAVASLRKVFLNLWKSGGYKIDLVFKAPTGSGKTIMIAQFLRDLTGDPQVIDVSHEEFERCHEALDKGFSRMEEKPNLRSV